MMNPRALANLGNPKENCPPECASVDDCVGAFVLVPDTARVGECPAHPLAAVALVEGEGDVGRAAIDESGEVEGEGELVAESALADSDAVGDARLHDTLTVAELRYPDRTAPSVSERNALKSHVTPLAETPARQEVPSPQETTFVPVVMFMITM